jgi:hypothetical protein
VKELQKKIDALRKVRVTLNQKTRVHWRNMNQTKWYVEEAIKEVAEIAEEIWEMWKKKKITWINSEWISDHNCLKEEWMFNEAYVIRRRIHISDNLLKVISLSETYRNKHSSTLRKMTEFCKHLSTVKMIWQRV